MKGLDLSRVHLGHWHWKQKLKGSGAGGRGAPKTEVQADPSTPTSSYLCCILRWLMLDYPEKNFIYLKKKGKHWIRWFSRTTPALHFGTWGEIPRGASWGHEGSWFHCSVRSDFRTQMKLGRAQRGTAPTLLCRPQGTRSLMAFLLCALFPFVYFKPHFLAPSPRQLEGNNLRGKFL